MSFLLLALLMWAGQGLKVEACPPIKVHAGESYTCLDISGYVDDWPQHFVCPDGERFDPRLVSCAKPELIDVPAIQLPTESQIIWGLCGNDCMSCTNGGTLVEDKPFEHHCENGKRPSCADKSRVLLTSEDGKKHCIKFGESTTEKP